METPLRHRRDATQSGSSRTNVVDCFQTPSNTEGSGHSSDLPRALKRQKLSCMEKKFPSSSLLESFPGYKNKGAACSPTIIDYSDPFSLYNVLKELKSGKFGSATKEITSLSALNEDTLRRTHANHPLSSNFNNHSVPGVIDLESHNSAQYKFSSSRSGSGMWNNETIIYVDSDDEDGESQAKTSDILSKSNWNSSYPYQKVVLCNNSLGTESDLQPREADLGCCESDQQEDKSFHGEGCEDDMKDVLEAEVILRNNVKLVEEACLKNSDDDGLAELWREMALAAQCSEDADIDDSIVLQMVEPECEHSIVLKDDFGYVCRICGFIQKRIESIIDYQQKKESRSIRTYASEIRNAKAFDKVERTPFSGNTESTHDFTSEISIHPRHMKQMKPHQLEGFKFLVKNLVAENPGGCILAHAPGSGKTFLIISFIQCFLAKFPLAKPLVVLPKGILSTWKKEFMRWQIEDIPLFDLYTASNRAAQLEVLNNWVAQKSVLFLGYKQFSNILCESAANKIEAECQEKLLQVPTLLILDEGHTPRNQNTDVVHTLSKVHTPRKVVLSGTLFQNHVAEVFNILNLVRPRFLKLDKSRAIVRRILSKVQISGGSRKQMGADSTFYNSVEDTLQKDESFERKASVINDLREMTCDVLHYYKGDFLEELPGLMDFTVVLKLTDKQKSLVQGIKKLEKFKSSSVGSAVYMHPHLKDISEKYTGEKGVFSFSGDKIDEMIGKLNVEDGVKTIFFLKMLSLAESAEEKVLVFSQYLLPLKFLERFLSKTKGWTLGKEMFTIFGDSSPEDRESSMDHFNKSQHAKVFFGSIKACGEGISLVGASRIIILDVHLNPSVTRQAIGRAFRPGQLKKVYTYRLVAADSPEEEVHQTSFCKELISKLWFEWSESCGTHHFNMEEVDAHICGDMFLESPTVLEDVKNLYRR